MRLFKSRRNLRSDKKGNVLIMTAAALPLLIGSAGLAIDTIQLSLMKRHLQRAVDSGALAGAFAKAQDKTNLVVEQAVDDALDYNDAYPIIGGKAAINHPTTGTHGGRSVRVQISAVRSLPFMSFFTGSPPTITVDATAALVYTGEYCMVSLDQGGSSPGVTFGGTAKVHLGCGVIANGSAANAINLDGTSTRVTASPVAAVGGVESADKVYQGDTLLLPYSLPQRDPFRDLEDPSPDCSKAVPLTNQASLDASILAGNKCFTSANISGTVTLPENSGDYFITGPLTLNGGSKLIGHGVTLVLTDNPNVSGTSYPTITYAGNADLDLKPPTSGPHEGLVLYYDRRAPLQAHTINGNSDTVLEGAFYFPSQHLTFNGNSDMEANCIQMVAHRLTFEGSTTITNNCDVGGDGAQNWDASWVRLVD